MGLYLGNKVQRLCNLAIFAPGRHRQEPGSRVSAKHCGIVAIGAQRLFAVPRVGGTYHFKERRILAHLVKGPLCVKDLVPAVL